MEKILVTMKEIKKRHSDIIKIGYCQAQYLLKHKNPFAYSTRSEGWGCDYYNVNGIIISTGYATIGNSIPYDLIESFENKAREIWCNYNLSYDAQLEKVENLIVEFIAEIKK